MNWSGRGVVHKRRSLASPTDVSNSPPPSHNNYILGRSLFIEHTRFAYRRFLEIPPRFRHICVAVVAISAHSISLCSRPIIGFCNE